jgi:ribonuclease P protein component
MHEAVDDLAAKDLWGGAALWLGAVVPKRHARRAVTRSLLKRLIRSVALRHAAGSPMPQGLWVVRLRAPFDRAAFASAASARLKKAARGELETLLAAAPRGGA